MDLMIRNNNKYKNQQERIQIMKQHHVVHVQSEHNIKNNNKMNIQIDYH